MQPRFLAFSDILLTFEMFLMFPQCRHVVRFSAKTCEGRNPTLAKKHELEVGPPHAINCYEKIAPLIFRHNLLRAEDPTRRSLPCLLISNLAC